MSITESDTDRGTRIRIVKNHNPNPDILKITIRTLRLKNHYPDSDPEHCCKKAEVWNRDEIERIPNSRKIVSEVDRQEDPDSNSTL